MDLDAHRRDARLARRRLPLTEDEARFLERLNGDGEIEAALLTTDSELQRRIAASPGLQWKALNVKKHAAGLDD